MGELQTLGKTCHNLPGEERLQCPGAANWKLIGDFLAARRDRSAALGALATTLSDADAGVRGLSVSILRSAFGGPWGSAQTPGRVDPDIAKRLLDGTLKLPTASAQQVVPAAVNAAMLAGQAALLFSELAKPQHAALRSSAYPYLMTVGRLQAFPKVKQLVKEGDVGDAVAAAEAPLNMEGWTEPEGLAICEWSESLLSDQRGEVALKAGQVLANCSGAFLDRFLDRSDGLLSASKLDATTQKPLLALCSEARQAGRSPASAAQCARARQLLVRVAESKQAEPAAREQALRAVARRWPDEESARLLKRLQQDASADVARGAREAAKALAKAATPEAPGPT